MSELVVKAAYATVAEQDNTLFIGFVDGKEENYILFTQSLTGGPLSLEVNDPDFTAEDAVERATLGTDGLVIYLRANKSSRFGYASRVAVRLKSCDDCVAALTRLERAGVVLEKVEDPQPEQLPPE